MYIIIIVIIQSAMPWSFYSRLKIHKVQGLDQGRVRVKVKDSDKPNIGVRFRALFTAVSYQPASQPASHAAPARTDSGVTRYGGGGGNE